MCRSSKDGAPVLAGLDGLRIHGLRMHDRRMRGLRMHDRRRGQRDRHAEGDRLAAFRDNDAHGRVQDRREHGRRCLRRTNPDPRLLRGTSDGWTSDGMKQSACIHASAVRIPYLSLESDDLHSDKLQYAVI